MRRETDLETLLECSPKRFSSILEKGCGRTSFFQSVLQHIRRLCRRTPTAATLSALVVLIAGSAFGQETQSKRWEAGAYSFSDELGGFRIVGAEMARKENPIVIREEIDSRLAGDDGHPHGATDPAVRLFWPLRQRFPAYSHRRAEQQQAAWIEFEFELQEHLGKASVFGDGLSFDQRRSESGNIWSESFQKYSRAFEPYDRLLFRKGRSTTCAVPRSTS